LRSSSRRTTKLIGGALFAAAIAATSVATVSTVSADIGDILIPAQIRVKPVNAAPGSATSGEDQNAAVIVAGASAQPASDVQLLIPSDWEAGDRITLQVQADGSIPPALIPVHQTNCQNVAQTISFAGTAEVVVTGGPWLNGAGWSVGDGFGTGPGTDNVTNNPDPKIPGTQTVRPEFIVNMKNDGTSCAGQPSVTNQIEIIFSNSASPTLTPGVPVVANTDQFELTISKIAYNVGANVNAGPVHVVPYARFADELAANLLTPVPDYFGGAQFFPGNDFNNPSASTMFTNNAFISPVAITATGGSLVADGTLQPLGSVTITELVGDALDNGIHTLFVPNVDLYGVPAVTVAVTGNGAATGTAAIFNGFNAGPLGIGARIDLTLAGMTATKGVVTISGLAATTTTAGDVLIFVLGPPAPTKPLAYFTPDDQLYDGGNPNDALLYSDVNIPTLVAKFTTAVAIPSRIGGADRYETSAKIAANASSCSEWAVVVSGSSYPDALSANYLAGALSSYGVGVVPVLLVGTDSVPASIAAYMSAAGVKNVYVVGGTSAVSAAVQTALQATSATKCTFDSIFSSTNPVPNQKLNVVRISGADRYATNRAVVNAGADIFPANRNIKQLEFLQPGKRTAILATGTSFADALSAGGAVYGGIPLILTDGTTLSADAKGTLTDNDITQVIIIGGTAAVSDAVKTSVEAMGIFTGRISGADRYATATAFADFWFKAPPSAPVAGGFDGGLARGGFPYNPPSGLLLTSGVSFADALSGGPLSSLSARPIILTDPTTLSAASQSWMVANKVYLFNVTALGLGSAVSTGVLNAANAAIS